VPARTIAALAVGLACLVGPSMPAVAATATVGVGDFQFTPKRAAGAVGDTVSWEWDDNVQVAHDVREDHGLFSSGSLTSNPSAVFRREPSAGSFHYYCTAHGSPSGGMAGTIKVSPTTGDGPAGAPFAVTWATSTQTGSAFDVQYRKAGGTWRGWKSDAAAFGATFGKRNKPLAPQPGEIYEVRVRSQADGPTPARVSGWSPAASYAVP
jgi:plastocyanin